MEEKNDAPNWQTSQRLHSRQLAAWNTSAFVYHILINNIFFSCSLTLLKFLNQIASNTRKVFCTKYTKVHFWFARSVLQYMTNEIHQTCTCKSSIIENFLKDGQKPRETMFKQNSQSKVILNTTHFTIIVSFGQIN